MRRPLPIFIVFGFLTSCSSSDQETATSIARDITSTRSVSSDTCDNSVSNPFAVKYQIEDLQTSLSFSESLDPFIPVTPESLSISEASLEFELSGDRNRALAETFGFSTHEYHRETLSVSRMDQVIAIHNGRSPVPVSLDISLNIEFVSGPNCLIRLAENYSRPLDAYQDPTLLVPDDLQPDFSKWSRFASMELPEPTAQAVSLAASWWEDYDSDGNYTHGDGIYVDLYVHKRIAPIRMAFFGDVTEENIRDYRDALEILKVIAPSLDIGFATSIDEVTLPIHFVGNCSVEELGERLHGEGCKYVGSYSFPYRPDDLPEAYETHRGFISHNSSSDRKARRMTRRNAVFHELGHALGLHHNYCEYSQMRSPNSKTTQPTNWGALDLMAIAAINNEAVKRGASYSSDYDEVEQATRLIMMKEPNILMVRHLIPCVKHSGLLLMHHGKR